MRFISIKCTFFIYFADSMTAVAYKSDLISTTGFCVPQADEHSVLSGTGLWSVCTETKKDSKKVSENLVVSQICVNTHTHFHRA